MQRPSLRHPLTSARHPAPPRPAKLARRASAKRAVAILEASATPQTTATQPDPTGELPPGYDFAARRVRDAGGPLDEATYSCACGCVFAASVTTSVCCPHCGAHQAW